MKLRRWIPLMLLVSMAALLALLAFTRTMGTLERSAAFALVAAVLILSLLHLSASRRLLVANRELEDRLAEATRSIDENEKSTQSILDGIEDPAMIIDTDHKVSMLNKSARQVFGVDEKSGEPLHCYRAMYGVDEPCDPSRHACTLITGQSCKEIQTRRTDGSERLVEVRSTPLRDASGRITGAIEVVHNLNEQELMALELQRATEDAETARRTREEFVATMSHEARTPMNAVLGMADLLHMTDLTRKQRSYVDIIQSSGNLLLSFVDNMLDLAQLGSGSLKLSKAAFQLTDLLEGTLKVMSHHAYSKGIELAGSIRHDPALKVVGDRERLRQIMINLIGNAIKFTDSGQVLVQVDVDEGAEAGARLTVSVADSGIGMSDEARQRAFRPLARADGERAAGGAQGSGLGLAISKRLLDLMGGELAIESELGRGTTVRFTVPTEIVSPESVHAPLRGRVLIVNGNDAVAAAICDNLSALGLCCEREEDPNAIPERLRAAVEAGEPFDAAIIDIDLPDADGLAVARTIRAAETIGDVPIVLLTSITRPLGVGEISAIGNVRCVNKPALPAELRQALPGELRGQQADPAVPARPAGYAALRVLVAEDNPISRRLLLGLLESLDVAADCVGDGPAALHALEREDYDLLLMDCQMPGLDGDEVTRTVVNATGDRYRRPIIVAVTADVSSEHRMRCLRAGMDDFLAKPVRLDTLRDGLNRWSVMMRARRDNGDGAPAGHSREVQSLLARMRERVGEASGGSLDEYIDLFLSDTTTRLEVLRAALERDDVATVRRECHALKGACLELGVSKLGQCCDVLRDASRNGGADAMPAALRHLSEEFDRVRPLFEAGKNASI